VSAFCQVVSDMANPSVTNGSSARTGQAPAM
jgi:hypothetical protein